MERMSMLFRPSTGLSKRELENFIEVTILSLATSGNWANHWNFQNQRGWHFDFYVAPLENGTYLANFTQLCTVKGRNTWGKCEHCKEAKGSDS